MHSARQVKVLCVSVVNLLVRWTLGETQGTE